MRGIIRWLGNLDLDRHGLVGRLFYILGRTEVKLFRHCRTYNLFLCLFGEPFSPELVPGPGPVIKCFEVRQYVICPQSWRRHRSYLVCNGAEDTRTLH